jgi:hypothetical protein
VHEKHPVVVRQDPALTKMINRWRLRNFMAAGAYAVG